MISSVGRSHWQAGAIGAALLAGVVAIALAAITHKAIRRMQLAQLAASTALALLIAPAELLSGMPVSLVLCNVAAWASLFTGSSLAVRAVFARAKRQRGRARWLSSASVLSPTCAALLLKGEGPAMRVAMAGSVGMLLVALWRPTPKKLKATGLTLALVVVTALVVELAL